MSENPLSSQDEKGKELRVPDNNFNILMEVQNVEIDNVKPEMLRAHLMLLTKFKALEQADEQID
ncbi:2496_t:CDS:1, partial [Diversispora eburnea]